MYKSINKQIEQLQNELSNNSHLSILEKESIEKSIHDLKFKIMMRMDNTIVAKRILKYGIVVIIYLAVAVLIISY